MKHCETCEPCGDCAWCRENFQARRDVKVLRAALRRALNQISNLAWAVSQELSASGPDEIAENPTLRRRERQVETARRVAQRLEPLTRKKSRA